MKNRKSLSERGRRGRKRERKQQDQSLEYQLKQLVEEGRRSFEDTFQSQRFQ